MPRLPRLWPSRALRRRERQIIERRPRPSVPELAELAAIRGEPQARTLRRLSLRWRIR